MPKTLTLTLSLCLVTLLGLPGAAADEGSKPEGAELMRSVRAAARVSGAEALSTLTITKRSGKRSRQLKLAVISRLYDEGRTEKRLLRFVGPAKVKGTGFLTWDHDDRSDDLWIFLPGIGKTRRILGSERAKSFMGSEFSYADITPPPVDDFTYTVLRSEQAEGVDCWVVSVVPSSGAVADENGFSKQTLWVAKDQPVVRRAVYYDLKGRLHKELRVLAVKEVDPANHRFRATHMVVDNKQNGRRSEMKVDTFRLRPDAPDEYFTERYLERQ